jgi:hypothetical protein
MTSREQFELEHFNISPAKVGKKTPAFWIHQAPSAWRRSLKGWVALALGWVLGTLFGVCLVLVWEMTK